MYKISLILPLYNIPLQYFEKCIESIRHQSYKNYECIIVDDGSKKQYDYQHYLEPILKDKRFKYYYKENEGTSIARNYGFDKSQGDLIWFIDPDDYIEDEAFLRVIKIFIENPNIDFVNFSMNRVDEYDNVLEVIKNSINNCVFNNIDSFKKDYMTSPRILGRDIYKKSFLMENNLRHQNIKNIPYEDVYFFLCAYSTAKTIFISSDIIINYVKRSGSVTNTINQQQFLKWYVFNATNAFNDFFKHNNNSVFFVHFFKAFYLYPYFNKEIRRKIVSNYNIFKKNNVLSITEKIFFFITSSSFLSFLYKYFYKNLSRITYKIISLLKK